MQTEDHFSPVLYAPKHHVGRVPVLLAGISVLLVILGTLSVISLQRSLQVAQDIRNQASVGEQGVAIDGCFVTGCNHELCSDRSNIATTCEFQPQFTCYQTAVCKRTNGQCGWVQTDQLQACLAQKQSAQPSPISVPPIVQPPTATLSASPAPSCIPRPACLDAHPACLIPLRSDYCPPATPAPILPQTCRTNVDCPANQECYQPPMFSCPPGAMCPQFMPAKICRPLGSVSPAPTASPAVSPIPSALPAPSSPFPVPVTSPTPTASASPEASPSPAASAPLLGDLNHDGKVDLIDYSILSSEFLMTGPNLSADLNHDGKVDLRDYSLFVSQLSP